MPCPKPIFQARKQAECRCQKARAIDLDMAGALCDFAELMQAACRDSWQGDCPKALRVEQAGNNIQPGRGIPAAQRSWVSIPLAYFRSPHRGSSFASKPL